MKLFFCLPILLSGLTGCSLFYDWPPIDWSETASRNAEYLKYQFASPEEKQYKDRTGEYPSGMMLMMIRNSEKEQKKADKWQMEVEKNKH